VDVGKDILEHKKNGYDGHIMRILRNRLPRRIVDWATEGTRRKGRPKAR